MRIIAGIAGGRKLNAPPDKGVRPTPDRVREALFSILAPYFPGAHVLDLFAGTGAVGLEALSRGAEHVTLVEKDKRAFACVSKNRALIQGGDAKCLNMHAHKALKLLAQKEQQFDIVFLDPPFKADLLSPSLERLFKTDLLKPNGCAIAEHGRHQNVPAGYANWFPDRTKHYGDVSLTFFHQKEPEDVKPEPTSQDLEQP